MTVIFLLAGSAQAATLERVSSFGSNPGNLDMFRYIPDNLPANAPLVVVMHGCTQSASAYSRDTGWQDLADTHGFALVVPEQKSGNNFNKCFNWFEVGDTNRGQGEARSIISMVDHMIANFDLDTNRIFATGLSAGGAMTTVMLAAYPDVFAGGAVMAGLPYRCATDVVSAFDCMGGRRRPSDSQLGNAVRNATNFSGPWPVVSVFHGTNDNTVVPSNLESILGQWTNVHGIDKNADATETVRGATRRQYRDGAGDTVIETWTIPGMGHATAVDPGTGAEQCGAPGAFIEDANICSSFFAARHWGLFDGDNPPEDPTDPPGDPTDPPDEPTDPPDEPTDPPDDGHVCTTFTSNNFNHVSAGRAVQSFGLTYAVGSNDAMGLWNVFVTTTLAETAPGFFEVGSCP